MSRHLLVLSKHLMLFNDFGVYVLVSPSWRYPENFSQIEAQHFSSFTKKGVDRNMCYTCSFRQSPYVDFLNPRPNETYSAERENERRYTVRKVKYYVCTSTKRVVPKHEFYSFGVGHLTV